MQAFLHQLSAGLATGSVYAAIGLALVMVEKSTHLINFAQGEMATFSTFVAWALIQHGFPYWEAFALTVVLSFVEGVLLQRIVIRPFEGAPLLTNVIVFVALMVTFNALSGLLFGHTVKQFPSPFSGGALPNTKYFTAHGLGSIAVILVELVVLFCFFRFSMLGLAMRAAAQNPASAQLVGVRVPWMLALGWGLAAAIGGIAGMMVAPTLYLDPNMMGGVFLYGFLAALLGGIENPWGAVLGGFIVGVLENLLGAYVTGTELKLSVALVLIVFTLILRPNGLFGKAIVSRV